MGSPNAAPTWVVDEQQLSYVRHVFELTLHDEPISIGLGDIDEHASLSIGQNRQEMALDADTSEIIALYLDEGVAMPMPLVWKRDHRQRRVVVLDGNHRLDAGLRRRKLDSVPCVLVTGDTTVAQNLAVVVNTMHGRSVRTPEYVAQSMRLLRERGVPVITIARMFGVPEDRVYLWTRRDEQSERARELVPSRAGKLPAHTLDVLGMLEDEHVRILGTLFLDAPQKLQREIVDRLKSAASADRDRLAHEAVGELRAQDEARRKVKPKGSRPSSQLADALSRLRGVRDPVAAYHQATDPQRAVMRSNLTEVLPRLTRLLDVLVGDGAVA
jgi:hypothetical protein